MPRKQNENYVLQKMFVVGGLKMYVGGEKLFIDGFPFRTLEKISHYVNK